MLRQFIYPADVEREEAGYFLVTFPDFPEAGTDGQTLAEAAAGRIVRAEDIPQASRKRRGQYAITLPAQMAAKAALYLAMKETGISKSKLARRLGCDEKEVRRLLDPKHPSKLLHIEEALAAIGQELVVGVRTIAAG